METSTLLMVSGILLLLVVSALSSAIETALTSVSRIRIMQRADEDVPNAKVVLKLLEQPSRYLATILLINNLANIAAASLATLLAQRVFGSSAAAVATGTMTFLVLVFGEISPKSFAAQNAERVALRFAKLMHFLTGVLYPVGQIFIAIANGFIRLFGGKVTVGPFVTEEEIKALVTAGAEEAAIEEEEKEMIHSIFEFGDTIVREVMVPRTDMVTVEIKASLQDVLNIIIKEGHSRIPVYEESIDNIVGLVYAKDLLVHLNKAKNHIPPLKKIMRPAYYVTETKKVSDLLKEMQQKKMHMAIVLDEYGGTAGLVTIEDLLEEIVGEIFDEYDLEEAMIEVLSENKFRLDARAPIDEVGETLGVKFPEYGGETIGGFVYNLVGHIPVPGETADFNSLHFEVEKVMGRRILKILVTKKEEHQEV